MKKYDWIKISEIQSVIERLPYLEIIYKDGISFFIDWTVENKDRFIISQSAER